MTSSSGTLLPGNAEMHSRHHALDDPEEVRLTL
jgi:hypothetical protein